jgi:hypothetical protein
MVSQPNTNQHDSLHGFGVADLPPPAAPAHPTPQATDVLRGSGSLSAERKEYLEGLGSQLGLSNDERDKIIREARTEALGAAAAFEGEERWTVEKVRTCWSFIILIF